MQPGPSFSNPSLSSSSSSPPSTSSTTPPSPVHHDEHERLFARLSPTSALHPLSTRTRPPPPAPPSSTFSSSPPPLQVDPTAYASMPPSPPPHQRTSSRSTPKPPPPDDLKTSSSSPPSTSPISTVRFTQRISSSSSSSPPTHPPPPLLTSPPTSPPLSSTSADTAADDEGDTDEDPHSRPDADDTEELEELDDLVDPDWSGSDTADSPRSLTFDDAPSTHPIITSTSPPSTTPPPPSPLTILLSILSLSIAVLSLSAVGPMFLFLEKERAVPAILAAAWRCQAMLLFISIPTLVECWHMSDEEKVWSHLHVPPSPGVGGGGGVGGGRRGGVEEGVGMGVGGGGGRGVAGAAGVSPAHRKGVPSMIEMQDVDRIATFLDGEEDGGPAGTGEEEEEEKEEIRLHKLTDMAEEGGVGGEVGADAGADGGGGRRGRKRVRISIQTVVTQSKMRLVHVSWYVLAVGLTWAGSLALWVWALCYTSTARASLFSSTYPLILLAWMRWRGVQVSAMETVGVFIALVGIVTSEVVGYFTDTERIPPIDLALSLPTLPALDPSSSTTTSSSSSSPSSSSSLSPSSSSSISSPDGWESCQVVAGSSSQLLGDVLCIVASFLNAMNIVWASRARRVLRLFSYTLCTTAIVTLSLCVLTLLAESTPLSLSPHGLFGWLVDPHMFVVISAFGFVVGCIGVLGQNFAVRYTSPVIFSVTQLLDPGLTAFMSWLAGLEGWPSLSTGLGVCMVGLGIGFVVVGENGRKKKQAEAGDVHSYEAVQAEEQQG